MIDDSSRIEAAVVATFLARVHADLAGGRALALEHYLTEFADWHDVIRREYEALAADTEPLQPEASDPGPVLRPGRHVERLVDRGLIARGGMAEIRRVWDRELRRLLALKRLDPSHGTSGSKTQLLRRFLEEAQVTAGLEHPGIVPVHELGIDQGGRVYFTMALVRGRNFKEVLGLLAEGRDGWTRTRALHVLLRVCETVSFAHSRGVIHRDLKPANVMVGPFGEVYVMDWGLARVLDGEDPCAVRIAPEGRAAHTPHADRGDGEGGSPATMDGDVVGTPAYMAPEQARGEVRRIDQRADVYAIGAMLYEVLAGRPPYANGGDPASQRTVLARVLAGAPAPLHTLDGSLAGTELAAICDRAMAREPEQRYRDMRALADDLRAYLEVRVVDAYERGTFAELRKWMQRNRALTTASALGVVALVAGLVASLLLMNRVEGQARRAERNAVWASDAVDSLLTKIAEEQLEDAPAAQPLRRELLREAVRFLREFVAVRRDDAGSAEELYRAYARLATAHIQLAEFDQAAEATRRAADLVDALLTDQPGRVDLRADRCWLRDMEACELLRRQQPAAARDLWERALVELRALHDRHPEDARVLARLGSVLTNLAVARRTERAHDEAAVLSAESIDIGRKALALDGSRANEDSLAGRIANYAAQLLALSRDAEAEQVANGHLQVLDRLLDAEPGRRQLAAARANLRNVQGLLRRRASDDAAAEALFARASTEWQQLVDSHPDLPRYRHNLAGALLNRARVLVELGQRTAAAATFDAAVTHMETVLRSDPGTAEYRQRMRRAAVEAGTAHARSGDHQTAARHAARLLALTGLGARPRRDAASLYCQCARLTASDADRTLHADYRRRATELIDALLEDGVLDAADLARTPWRWVR